MGRLLLLGGAMSLLGAVQVSAAGTDGHPIPDAQTDEAVTEAASAPMLEGDEDSGFAIYAESCRGCHSGAIAPSLKGAFGRPIASVAGYSYSDGLQAHAGDTWTAENLDAFLQDPSAFAAGTKMMVKVEDAQERADLIALLQALPE